MAVRDRGIVLTRLVRSCMDLARVSLARTCAVQHAALVEPVGASLPIPCRAAAVSQGSFNDQPISITPVVAVAGEQPHAPAVALDDQPVAFVLDFVKPLRPVRNLRRLSECRDRTEILAYEIFRRPQSRC